MNTIAGLYDACCEIEHFKRVLCASSFKEVEGYFSSLLPCGAFAIGYEGTGLFDTEAAAINGVSETRQREFASGRAAAHRALRKLGFSPSPVLKGDSGEPLWPKGVVGSISHCKGLALCGVAFSKECTSIGVDVEEVNRVRPSLAQRILTETELYEWERDEDPLLLAVAFSAKEAFFKFQYPIAKASVGFKEVMIEHNEEGIFKVIPLRADLPEAKGAFCFVQGRVFAVVWKTNSVS